MMAGARETHWALELPAAVRRLGERIAEEHHHSFAALVEGRRLKTVTEARHRWIAITKWTLGLSYPEAGRMFGMDHTSIMALCKKLEARLAREWKEGLM